MAILASQRSAWLVFAGLTQAMETHKVASDQRLLFCAGPAFELGFACYPFVKTERTFFMSKVRGSMKGSMACASALIMKLKTCRNVISNADI
jgi:hypothetical protein